MLDTASLAADLEAVAGGDEAALRRLWDAAAPTLLGLSPRLVRRRATAEAVCLVLEGELCFFGDLPLAAGDCRKGHRHPDAVSRTDCLLYIGSRL